MDFPESDSDESDDQVITQKIEIEMSQRTKSDLIKKVKKANMFHGLIVKKLEYIQPNQPELPSKVEKISSPPRHCGSCQRFEAFKDSPTLSDKSQTSRQSKDIEVSNLMVKSF